MLTGRRYLLRLTSRQQDQAEQFGNACRAVWNAGPEQRREYRRRGGSIGYVEQGRQLAEAKKDPYSAWPAEAPSHILQQTLRDLDRACETHGTGKVRWRPKTKTRPASRFPDPKQMEMVRLTRRWGQVKLPKLGWVRLRWTRPSGGVLRNATVLRDGGRWYVSFCVDDGVAPAAPDKLPPIGVDRGAVAAVATSEGGLIDREFATAGEVRRAKRLQQRLTRCHDCGHIARKNRENQAVFRCVACGHADHADVNAAKNILAAGLAVTGRGDLAIGRSRKRQPPVEVAA
ncbi:RNA-guided endonuclease InsQ/TnpB family protein [Actinoplanes subtropicus]|uniref:RNA-guided endonuclease InsQ/TnpB family protein n=1 Tax=Actinoplanes subtropicus TaxID=543632 RepID=UPI0004C447A1|nr:zinc ribbon domain-containing protein [Actinoplanes subtropicus]